MPETDGVRKGVRLMDQQDPGGNPEVIAALNQAYVPALTAFEQFHRQEHRLLKKYQYKHEAKRFDKMVNFAHCVRHKILNRIEGLGGEVDSRINSVTVSDNVKDAYENTISLLKEIYEALGRAVAVAQSANDHPTIKMLMMLQAKTDKKIRKYEAHMRQMNDLGNSYMLTSV